MAHATIDIYEFSLHNIRFNTPTIKEARFLSNALNPTFEMFKGTEPDHCGQINAIPPTPSNPRQSHYIPLESSCDNITNLNGIPLSDRIPLRDIYDDIYAHPAHASYHLEKMVDHLVSCIQSVNMAYTKASLMSIEHVERMFEGIVHPQDQCIVIGDIHGSFHSLYRTYHRLCQKKIIMNGHLDAHYCLIFTGDVIDVGYFTLPVLSLIFQLINLNPHSVFYIKGNHESKFVERSFAQTLIRGSRPNYIFETSFPKIDAMLDQQRLDLITYSHHPLLQEFFHKLNIYYAHHAPIAVRLHCRDQCVCFVHSIFPQIDHPEVQTTQSTIIKQMITTTTQWPNFNLGDPYCPILTPYEDFGESPAKKNSVPTGQSIEITYGSKHTQRKMLFDPSLRQMGLATHGKADVPYKHFIDNLRTHQIDFIVRGHHDGDISSKLLYNCNITSPNYFAPVGRHNIDKILIRNDSIDHGIVNGWVAQIICNREAWIQSQFMPMLTLSTAVTHGKWVKTDSFAIVRFTQ